MAIVNHPGHMSPLAEIKSEVASVITHTVRLRQCLTPSQAVQLVNSVINGTATQNKLINWKVKYLGGEGGIIGKKYWVNFKKRHGHLICSKRGKQYDLDRAAWSTYANFRQMYEQMYDMMVEASPAEELDNQSGKISWVIFSMRKTPQNAR